MRCVVTGASGHLGIALTRRLVEEGAEVYLLVRPESDLRPLAGVLDRVQLLYGELDRAEDVAEQLLHSRPEVFFHLAWSGITSSYRNQTQQITRNVTGSLKLWEAAREAGCRCWIGMGSQAEYGPQNQVLNEDLAIDPVTAYGVAKSCLGALTLKLSEMAGMRCVWFRLLSTYGPYDDKRHLIPSVVNQLLEGKTPSLTMGEQQWDYLYVEDAAEALYRAAINEIANGIYVLGSGQVRSLRSIVEQLRDLINPKILLGFGEVPYSPDQVMHLQADISRLTKAIDWTPKVSLEEGLRRTVEWHRSLHQL